MGNRREPRHVIDLPLRIFGTDANGHIFSEKVTTVNVSLNGVEVRGLKANVKLDEIVGINYSQQKAHFRVKWVGQAGTPKNGHIGLANLSPDKPLWNFPLPSPQTDPFHGHNVERRRHPRMKVSISVELHPDGGSLIWGNSTDLSLGGFYVEMPIPLTRGTKLRAKLWMDKNKLWIAGKVTSSTPGFGFGVQFTEISETDLVILKNFISSKREV